MGILKKRAWQGSIIDKSVSLRFKKLGDLGEVLAQQLLQTAGFSEITNLNKNKKNTKSFDITAVRGNESFAISVKARNKYENSIAGKKLNSRYKLTDDPELFKAEAKEIFDSHPAWVTISLNFDEGIFDSYFGLLSDLHGNKKGISMTQKNVERYEILAKQESIKVLGISISEMEFLKNKYVRRLPKKQ